MFGVYYSYQFMVGRELVIGMMAIINFQIALLLKEKTAQLNFLTLKELVKKKQEEDNEER